MVHERQKLDLVFLIWLVITAFWNIVSFMTPVRGLAGYMYMGLLLFWVLSLKREIPDRYVRHRLMSGGILLILLFVFRKLRWDVVASGSAADRLMWYLYYIPTLVTPLLSLSVSLHIGGRDRERTRRRLFPFVCICFLFCLLALTNDLHEGVLKITYSDGTLHSRPAILFYIFLIWSFGLMLAAFFIMLAKCRISEVRKHWWIPALWEGTGLLLWLIYYANMASSPKIGGISLYNIQEVYILLFPGLWENCIRIGLIPSVSLARERDWIREGVIRTVSAEIQQMRDLYDRMRGASEEQFKKILTRMACLGAYIKRRANLEFIADERRDLPVGELSLAIRESFDYYALAGISVGYEETGSGDIPALLLICAYELFEDVLEHAQSACYVKVQVARTEGSVGFKMEVDTDPYPEEQADGKSGELIARNYLDLLGASIRISEEDDTRRLTLSASYQLRRSELSGLFSWFGAANPSYGLSGLMNYLSLEKEALAARISVHDGLGRCLLLTKRYLTFPEKVGREEVQMKWGRVLAIIREDEAPLASDSGETGGIYESIRQAGAMGVEVEVTGSLPQEPKLLSLIDTAVTVHVTNVLKHTDGKRAMIRSEKEEQTWKLTLTDDAQTSGQVIRETGGLKNLREQIQAIGGSMTVEGSPQFVLTLTLPEETEG